MTLGVLVLKKSHESIKYPSPPPEVNDNNKRKYVDKFSHVKSKVDSSPPKLDVHLIYRKLKARNQRATVLLQENIKLVQFIRNAELNGGRVDSRWKTMPPEIKTYYYRRKDFVRNIDYENERIYRLIKNAVPRLIPTKELEQDWIYYKKQMVSMAKFPFVMFPMIKEELCEDLAFQAPSGFVRPRIFLELKIKDWYKIGAIEVELFWDVCPVTCGLFLELLRGDGGYGYVGTRFFRIVPGLYWSGGDVIYNNGFGCYAQKGRKYPIGAENYHFSHSMPGLISMRVTQNNEVCGVFNVTFKPLPQLDLHNVIFGRVIRPSKIWDKMINLNENAKVILNATRYCQPNRKKLSWRPNLPAEKEI